MGSSLLLLHFILTLSVHPDDVCVAFLCENAYIYTHPTNEHLSYNKTIDLTYVQSVSEEYKCI